MIEKQENIINADKRILFDWKELLQYHELFYFFAWRDIKVKYKQTVLGVLWVVLQPLLTVLVFSIFFGRALNVPSSGLPYPVFVFSGLLLWNLFSTSVSSAGNSMISNASIIKKIYFPRIIIPISAILVSCVDFLIAFVIFLGLLIFYQVKINVVLILISWPLAILLLFFSTLGISCWLSALNVKYRDFRYVIPFGLQIALFVSPVIYPISVLGNTWLNYILAINPMYTAITLFRLPFTGINNLNIDLIIISSLSGFIFFIGGIYYFKRTEAYFADIA